MISKPFPLSELSQIKFFNLRIGDIILVDSAPEIITSLLIVDEPAENFLLPYRYMDVGYRNYLLLLRNGELKKKEFSDSSRQGSGKFADITSFAFTK